MTIKIIKNKEYYRQFEELFRERMRESESYITIAKMLDKEYERRKKWTRSKNPIRRFIAKQILKTSTFFYSEAEKSYKLLLDELNQEMEWLMNYLKEHED